ncbi:VWA domain-containing protein [Marinomonas sp. THO17]|uniref:VWA domain-containing protein n=1 Tax=Marinomonas sp. THO17 TaxID=3149048 RepID=UPI00336BED4C
MKWLKIRALLLLVWLGLATPVVYADAQFRVIVDASGSMLISDPDKLTSEALRLISNLAPDEKATLGIWLFGEAPRVLVPEAPVNAQTKARVANYVNSYVTQDVKTDLEAIIKLLLETPDSGDLEPGFDRHWILVTDGMVDISLDEAENKASRERILNDLVQQLESLDIHLHTISMTGYTDKLLLENLSLRTNATHTEVAVPQDLLDTFERIFSQASPSDELPFEGDQFVVDEAINELTLVVFHEKGEQPEVILPDNTVLPLVGGEKVAVSAADHYTLISVQDPMAGIWQVKNVDLSRSSVRVITDLGAQATKIAPVIFVNEPIFSSIGLFQDGVLVQDPQILDLLKVEQTLYRLNGEQKEPIVGYDLKMTNNQFKVRLEGISEPGNYELVSSVDGQTFQRQLSQFFTLYPAIVFSGSTPSDDMVALTAKPVNLKLNLLRSSVMLEFIEQDGSQRREEMPLIGQGYWEKVMPISPDDHLLVQATLLGVTQAGLRFEYTTPQWHLDRHGEAKANVSQEGQSGLPSLLVTPTNSENREAMAVAVAPVVSVVEDDDEQVEGGSDNIAEENTEQTASDEDLLAALEDDAEQMTSTDWMLYAALNLGGFAIIAGGVILYRRIRKSKHN